jgi:hypothetical protein
MILSHRKIFSLILKGEPEDGQELPSPEPAPASVSSGNLSVTFQDEDRSSTSSPPLSTRSESVPRCTASLKEDAGEDTALLGRLLVFTVSPVVERKLQNIYDAEKHKGKNEHHSPTPRDYISTF